MSDRTELRDCEEVIADPDELQWRQVKAMHLDPETYEVRGVAFQDNSRCVSTSRSSIVDAASAMATHLALGLRTEGTWAVSVAEVEAAGCRVVADNECDDVEVPGHSYIDMRNLDKNARKIARAELATRATARRRQHP